MKILVTGARGFIGRNLISTLENINSGKDKSYGDLGELQIYKYDLETSEKMLDQYCRDCDFVFHLAGVNRPKNQTEFMDGNFGFTSILLNKLKQYQNICPIMLASSIHAELDNPYGQSKKAGEELLASYGKEMGGQIFIYRFPNVFGKWCRPNYNSVIATFCNNIARDIPIIVNDRETRLELVYIDDVVSELIEAMKGNANKDIYGYCNVKETYQASLGEIEDLIYSFKKSREILTVPDMDRLFEKKLYSTYLSYLPENKFSYPLTMHEDARGSFTEALRTPDRGQVSVNISKPGITKGQHWHHTKNEKFLVVSGKGLIQLRKVGISEDGNDYPVIEYFVSGDKLEIVDIPVGYTHNITNIGDTDMVTVMWCNECFDPERPDTYALEV